MLLVIGAILWIAVGICIGFFIGIALSAFVLYRNGALNRDTEFGEVFYECGESITKEQYRNKD